jgi:hypothetical protein
MVKLSPLADGKSVNVGTEVVVVLVVVVVVVVVLVVVVKVVDELAVPARLLSITCTKSLGCTYLEDTGYTSHSDKHRSIQRHRWWHQTSYSLHIGRTRHSAQQQRQQGRREK